MNGLQAFQELLRFANWFYRFSLTCNKAERYLCEKWDNGDSRPWLKRHFADYLVTDFKEVSHSIAWLSDKHATRLLPYHATIGKSVCTNHVEAVESLIDETQSILSLIENWLEHETGTEPWEDNPRRGLLIAIGCLQRIPLSDIEVGLAKEYSRLEQLHGYSLEQLELASQLSEGMLPKEVVRQVFPKETMSDKDARKAGAALRKAVERLGLTWHTRRRGRPSKK